jgi:hypothetical protein
MTTLSLMSTAEVDSLMKHSKDCADGECSLDEVADLIMVLKEQQAELTSRVSEIRGMIKAIEVVNESANRDEDAVRSTVRAIFRIFQMSDKASGNNYPYLSKAMGYSGDVGSGPTDAYKSLKPKPWKA